MSEDSKKDLGIIGPLSNASVSEKNPQSNDSNSNAASKVRRQIFQETDDSGKENDDQPVRKETKNEPVSSRRNLMMHYQKYRQKNIAENEEALRELLSNGLCDSKSEGTASKRQSSFSTVSPKKKRPRKKEPVRRSQRKTSKTEYDEQCESSCSSSSSRSSSPWCSDEASAGSTSTESSPGKCDSDSQRESVSPEKDSAPKSKSNLVPERFAGSVSPICTPAKNAPKINDNSACTPLSDLTQNQSQKNTPKTSRTPKTPKTPASEKALKKAALKSKMKAARNLGQKYVTGKGKEKPARIRKPPHTCSRNKCHEIVKPETADTIFKQYWEQGSHDKRVAYIAARTERFAVARRRSRLHVESREKHHTYKYYFDIDGKRVQVCRSTFLDTLGETDRFVRDAVENKKNSVTGISKDDTRGKRKPKHALKQEVRQAVLNHIENFPAYVSHYCRAQTQRLYLSPELNVQKMYDLYCDEKLPKVSYDVYRKIFKSTKKKFHAPKTDGCDTCDALQIKIAAAEGEEKTKLVSEKEIHNRKAEKAYQLKREAKIAAENDKSKRVLIFDLQQCLPTPHLTCKKIYYSRQLYVYNFTIYDSTTKLTHCYMWSEIEGRRGSNEIASCLLDYILKEVPSEVKELKLFSDCCSGQNRNSNIVMMLFLALQQHPSIEEINHILLVPGHTFMSEVDSKHAVIEKYKKNLKKVNVPEEWYRHVDEAGRRDKKNFPDGKFRVHHVTKFFDFSSLAKGPLVKRNVCLDKQPMNYMETHWFKYIKGEEGHVHVKCNFNEETSFKTLSFLRLGQQCGHLQKLFPTLQTVPAGPLPISAAKRNDLINLLPYLENKFHEFYESLKTVENEMDCDDLI